MVDLKKEISKMEGHDVIVLIGVGLLILMTIKLTTALTVFEAKTFLRESLVNIAILMLIADLVIHVGRLEEKILKEEEKILAEEAKIEKEEEKIEAEEELILGKRKPVKAKKKKR